MFCFPKENKFGWFANLTLYKFLILWVIFVFVWIGLVVVFFLSFLLEINIVFVILAVLFSQKCSGNRIGSTPPPLQKALQQQAALWHGFHFSGPISMLL